MADEENVTSDLVVKKGRIDEVDTVVIFQRSEHEAVMIPLVDVPAVIKRLQELYDETDTLEPSDDDN